MSHTRKKAAPGRRKFLVVVDDTPECRLALRFAARRAEHTGGGVTLLYVIPPADFQHWMAVEDLMRAEAREEAEHLLAGLAKRVHDTIGLIPELVIREGLAKEEIPKLIKEDPGIRVLVLGAAAEGESPGPLISTFVLKRTSSLPIPVTVVPGTLTPQQIDELT